MSQLSRRDFLKLLPLLPLMKVSWPHNLSQDRQLQQTSSPNILVLVFDTLSAKHMSFFGYSRETTPNLARFAEQATVFHNHRAAGNFTTPGTASILTGTYPWTHRAIHFYGLVIDDKVDHNIFGALPNSYYKTAYTHNVLAYFLLKQFQGELDVLLQPRELFLRDYQYADLFFHDDFNVASISERAFLYGQHNPPGSLFLSIFDRARRFVNRRQVTQAYGHLFPRGVPEAHGSKLFILEDAIDWMSDQILRWPAPFFAYVHLMPPHDPYWTRRDFVDVFADGWKPLEKPGDVFSQGRSQQYLNRQRRLYDEYLAYTDAEFGRLYDALQSSGVLKNTYFVLTSDHGELFERGILGHGGRTLYDPLLHVPLLIAKPGQQQRQDVHSNTSCVDLLPTFLHVSGQPIPEWCEGQVLPTFDSREAGSDRDIYALEATRNPSRAPLGQVTMAMVRDRYKLVHYLGYEERQNGFELYDLQADPEELVDLCQSQPEIAFDMQHSLGQELNLADEPYTI